ncbi:MAG: hypothetical protein JXR85_08470 [Deltaproteobacteria bacterium]|nr:hypothetical protein [Deltaproteobacteria bacterium]
MRGTYIRQERKSRTTADTTGCFSTDYGFIAEHVISNDTGTLKRNDDRRDAGMKGVSPEHVTAGVAAAHDGYRDGRG